MAPSTVRLTKPHTRDRSTPEAVGLPVAPGTRPGEIYIYVHYETSWMWVDRPGPDGERLGWLPRLHKVAARAGVNGVKDPGGRRPVRKEHMGPLLGGLAAKGAMVLAPEDARLGPYQYYDRYYDTQGGGKWFVEPGQEATVLRNGSILWNTDDIIPVHMEMYRYLRDEAPSLIHPLLREVWQGFMAREADRMARYIQQAGVTPGLGYRVEAQERRIALMTEDYIAYEASLGSTDDAEEQPGRGPLAPHVEEPAPRPRKPKTQRLAVQTPEEQA